MAPLRRQPETAGIEQHRPRAVMSKIHHKKSIGAASAGHESESTEGGWDLLYCLIKINLVCPMPRLRGWNEQQEVVNPPRPQPSTLLLFFVCLLSIERIECRGAKADGDGSATLSSETREERKWEGVKRSAEEIIRRLFRAAVTSWNRRRSVFTLPPKIVFPRSNFMSFSESQERWETVTH